MFFVNFIKFLLLMVLTASLLPAKAQDKALFTRRLNSGIFYYAYESAAILPILSAKPIQNEFSDTVPFIGLGGSVAYKNFFADVAYNTSLADIQDAYRSPIPEPIIPGEVDLIYNNRFSRDELTLTLGYSLTSKFSIFGGYRLSHRDLTTNPDFEFRAPPGFAYLPDKASVETNYDDQAKGPFIGTSYALPLGGGVLAMSAALGFFSQESSVTVFAPAGAVTLLTPDQQQIPIPTQTVDIQGETIESATTGLAVNLRYLRPINEKLTWEIGISGYRYEYKEDGKKTSDSILGFSDTTEDFLSLSFGLRYRF